MVAARDIQQKRSKMSAVGVCLAFMSFAFGIAEPSRLCADSYPPVTGIQRTFMVPDVAKANVSLEIDSTRGTPLYHFECHAAGYTGDPDFDYSGEFECRLSLIGQPNSYSTLLTEDAGQSRDWESRGRFFAAELRGPCAGIPEFGTNREFKLRGMDLSLQITDPTFTEDGKLGSLRVTVSVRPDRMALRSIAEVTPLPPDREVPAGCELRRYFVVPSASGGSR